MPDGGAGLRWGSSTYLANRFLSRFKARNARGEGISAGAGEFDGPVSTVDFLPRGAVAALRPTRAVFGESDAFGGALRFGALCFLGALRFGALFFLGALRLLVGGVLAAGVSSSSD